MQKGAGMRYRIGLCYGDAIGPEITRATETVMKAAVRRAAVDAEWPIFPMGWEGIEKYGDPVPQLTKDGLSDCHGWVFAPHDSAAYPPEQFQKLNPSGEMRRYFDLYANKRPAKVYPGAARAKSHVGEDVDLVVYRENTEGFLPDRNMYRGVGEFMPSKDMVISASVITRQGAERVAREAFRTAMKRRKHLTIVHKANVIKMAGELWRSSIRELGEREFPEVRMDDFHIDAMTAHLVRHPQDFDVIVCTNLFGDIISDLAGELTGSLGLGPGINTNDHQRMAQAAHGSAPDIAGKDIANPTGLMLSSAMMFDWLAERYKDPKLSEVSRLIEENVLKSMEEGFVTPDMKGTASCSAYGDHIASGIAGA